MLASDPSSGMSARVSRLIACRSLRNRQSPRARFLRCTIVSPSLLVAPEPSWHPSRTSQVVSGCGLTLLGPALHGALTTQLWHMGVAEAVNKR
jgi:hypothetical protein